VSKRIKPITKYVTVTVSFLLTTAGYLFFKEYQKSDNLKDYQQIEQRLNELNRKLDALDNNKVNRALDSIIPVRSGNVYMDSPVYHKHFSDSAIERRRKNDSIISSILSK
jgi:hypothetical protein